MTRRLTSGLLVGAGVALSALQAQAATFVLEIVDPAGQGFNDATPVDPVPGNAGTTLGEQRQIAFQFALDIWGKTIDSAVPIVVMAEFAPIDCTGGVGVLGQAGPDNSHYDDPLNPTVTLPGALADALAGMDLEPGVPDIGARFNGDISCFSLEWYYGTDGIPPRGQTDLVSTVLHEIGHGLGFTSYVDEETGDMLGAAHDGFTLNLVDAQTGKRWSEMTAEEFVAGALNVGNLVWDGQHTKDAASSWLVDGAPTISSTPDIGLSGSIGDANFGVSLLTGNVSGTVTINLAASDPDNLGCEEVSGTTGKIALLERGTCSMINKAYNVQEDGALGLIMIEDRNPPRPANVHPDDIDFLPLTIPIVTITAEDALALLGAPDTVVELSAVAGQRLGTNAAGQVLMYATVPVDPGSSVSHFDPMLRRDPIMEPSASLDVHYDLTMEAAVMRDMGWPMICGNGNVDEGEECDSGAGNSATAPDACRTNCTNPRCGDNVVDTGEECDPPGSSTETGVCHEGCRLSFCGDGEINPPVETCDMAESNSDTTPDACRTNCQPAGCGDGVVDTGEQCDETSASCVDCAVVDPASGMGGAGMGGSSAGGSSAGGSNAGGSSAGGAGVGGSAPMPGGEAADGCACRMASPSKGSRAWLALVGVLSFGAWRRRVRRRAA